MAQDYSKILKNPEIIQWAKESLKKRNRIEWYLKQVREYPHIHPSEELKHFYAMNIPSINDYLVKSEPINILLQIFKKLEIEYFNSLKKDGFLIADDLEPHKKILDLPEMLSEWKWINLNQRSSDIEAQAMGHCGNRGGNNSDSILSLRKLVMKGNKKYWEPHLTFILKHNGSLGEMKGRQNKKPHERYHPQILILLRSKFVSKIKGGGYLPHENFQIRDLKEIDREEFINQFPEKTPFQKLKRDFSNLHDFLEKSKEDEALDVLSWVTSEEQLLKISIMTSAAVGRSAIGQLTNFDLIVQAVSKAPVENLGFLDLSNLNGTNQILQLVKIALNRRAEKFFLALLTLDTPKEIFRFIIDFEKNHKNSNLDILRHAYYCLPSPVFDEEYERTANQFKAVMIQSYSRRESFLKNVILGKDSLFLREQAAGFIYSSNKIKELLDSEIEESIKFILAQQLLKKENWTYYLSGNMRSYSKPQYYTDRVEDFFSITTNPILKKYIPFNQRISYYRELKNYYKDQYVNWKFESHISVECREQGISRIRYEISRIFPKVLPIHLR